MKLATIARRALGARAVMALGLAAIAALPVAAATPVPPLGAGQPPLPGMTAREADYYTLWHLRVGLNVAALQCQYSKALRSANLYNAFLRQHSDELAAAYKGLDAYFRRTDGARLGPRKFDTENTRMYQKFSAVGTQRDFCEHAAMVARRALAVPKGQATAFAGQELGPFRATLDPAQVSQSPLIFSAGYVSVPDFSNCRGRRC